ncbi:MAG: hypothetical protein ACLS2V_12660 [Clostridium paraputrificum]|uniref:hypothetical protein n=1 Tax=Clostridium sp. TaxID=1506 RepID=UPI0025BA5734|nr:hypothetical protein [Clostridium sp.]MBS5926145.1 hypothetical protein [Clostridium sp.]
MSNNTTVLSEEVKKSYKDVELIELEKMYPGVRAEKYILFVQAKLWLPFENQNIDGNVLFINQKETFSVDTKVRTPFPNKTVSILSMKRGRKVCNLGVPLIFDSYEDLNKLKSVVITWKVSLINENNVEEVNYIQIKYNLDIIYSIDKNVYSISSYDSIIEAFKENDKSDIFMNKYDEIIILSREMGSMDFDYEYLTEDNISFEDKERKVLSLIADNITIKDYISILEEDKKVMLYSYEKDIVLIPSEVADNDVHIV